MTATSSACTTAGSTAPPTAAGVLSTLELAELTELWTGAPGGTPGRTSRTRRCPTGTGRRSSPCADCSRPWRPRPAGRGRDRDQAPDPVRRAGRAAAGGLLDEFGWAHRGWAELAGAGDELLPAVPAADAGAGARTCAPSTLWSGCRCGSGTARLPEGVAVAGPSIEIVRAHPRYVERVHRHGHPVHVWTVDTRRGRRRCASSSGWTRSSPTGRGRVLRQRSAGAARRDRSGARCVLFRPVSAGHGTGRRRGHATGDEGRSDGDGRGDTHAPEAARSGRPAGRPCRSVTCRTSAAASGWPGTRSPTS